MNRRKFFVALGALLGTKQFAKLIPRAHRWIPNPDWHNAKYVIHTWALQPNAYLACFTKEPFPAKMGETKRYVKDTV